MATTAFEATRYAAEALEIAAARDAPDAPLSAYEILIRREMEQRLAAYQARRRLGGQPTHKGYAARKAAEGGI